jgi:hypothetical protein
MMNRTTITRESTMVWKPIGEEIAHELSKLARRME